MWFASLLIAAVARTVTISNVQPRVDVNGKIIDAHDGSIQAFEDDPTLYYVHAVQYGLCKSDGCNFAANCGRHKDHNISMWTTRDFTNWEYHGVAVSGHEIGDLVIYRPHLIYNAGTKTYILWWNEIQPPGSKTGQYLGYRVATSSSPLGPFVLKNFINQTSNCGDFDFIIDKITRRAYIARSCNFYMVMNPLTEDYMNIDWAGENVTIPDGVQQPTGPAFKDYYVEAPAFWERNGIYYIAFGKCCCFCKEGSGIRVYMAPSASGPWVEQPGIENPGRDNGKDNGTSTTRAQQNVVTRVKVKNGGYEYMWNGDRWGQSPDGLKGHEPQFKAMLQFGEDGSVLEVPWVDEFNLDLFENNYI